MFLCGADDAVFLHHDPQQRGNGRMESEGDRVTLIVDSCHEADESVQSGLLEWRHFR
jgi:hypothetical protein